MKILSLIGFIAMFLAYLFSGRYRKKKGYDEVYERNAQKAQAFSWYTTLATILFLFWLFGFTSATIGIIPLLGILMFVHIASWGIALIVMTTYTYS